MLDRLATVQLDSVNVLARSHELVFFSRLGAYDRDALSRWLWQSREVFEYWGHEASLHPVERYPLMRWRMAGRPPVGRGAADASRDSPELERGPRGDHRAARAHRRDGSEPEGPPPGGELVGLGGDGKRGWSTCSTGQVTAVRRNGFTRYYMPVAVAAGRRAGDRAAAGRRGPPRAAAVAAAAHGIGTARDLADYYRLNVPRPCRWWPSWRPRER